MPVYARPAYQRAIAMGPTPEGDAAHVHNPEGGIPAFRML
jgi:hypothetical protein